MKTTDEILEAMWEVAERDVMDTGDLLNSEIKAVKSKWKRIFKKHGIGKPSRVVVKLGNGHWLCSSDSRPGDYHSIEYVGASDYCCSCEKNQISKKICHHIDTVREVEVFV